MKTEIKCLTCGEEMVCLGNTSGIVYTSYPPQWDVTYVCHKCKTKRTVREREEIDLSETSSWRDYEEQSNLTAHNV
jgi:hypothetical protein